MQLTYYNNRSDKRYVNKTIDKITKANHTNPVNITLIDSTDIIHPIFKVKDKDIYMTSNYCYVDDLRRYYYIDKITLENGYGLIHCTVDVLMTYKKQLRLQNVIVSRQEHHWDLFQNDPLQKVSQRTAIRTVKFTGGSGFSYGNQQFILGILGEN